MPTIGRSIQTLSVSTTWGNRCVGFLHKRYTHYYPNYYLELLPRPPRYHRSHEQRLLWLYAEWAGSSRRCVWEHMKLSRRRDLGEPCSAASYRRRCHRAEASGGDTTEITPTYAAQVWPTTVHRCDGRGEFRRRKAEMHVLTQSEREEKRPGRVALARVCISVWTMCFSPKGIWLYALELLVCAFPGLYIQLAPVSPRLVRVAPR